MANNKILFGEEVLLDLTGDTVTPDTLAEGYVAHDRSGEPIVGVMTPNKPVDVASNDAMTAIAARATESDLGKVYLFVGEDDGVYEKDALYVLVKKGTGYGFQRYAIGGSGESQECDCVIDVTELPTGGGTPVVGKWTVAELNGVEDPTTIPPEVENIYFNTALSNEEVAKILSGLTYTDFGGINAVLPAIGISDISTSADMFLLMVAQSGSDYGIAFQGGAVGMLIVYATGALAAEFGASFNGWNPDFNGTFAVNGVLCASGETVDDGLTVDNQQEKYSGLISLTPGFEPADVDETAIYRVTKKVNADVYYRYDAEDSDGYLNLKAILASEGITCEITYYVLDAYPESPEVTNFQTFNPGHVYIINDIPQVYGDMGSGNTWVTVTDMLISAGVTTTDCGFTADIRKETQIGTFVTYKDEITLYYYKDGEWHGGGGSGGAGGIVDVEELPDVSAIDETVIYRTEGDFEGELYIKSGDSLYSFRDFVAAFQPNATLTYYTVDTLPADPKITITNVDMHMYILKSSGYVYSTKDGTTWEVIETSGWVNSTLEMTAAGYYVLRVSGGMSYGIPVSDALVYHISDGEWRKMLPAKDADILNEQIDALTASANFTDYAVLSGSTGGGITLTKVSDDSITCMKVQGNVTEIGQSAFYNFKNLTDVTLPDSLTRIGHQAFAYCTNLTSIAIPAGVTSIDPSAYIYCRGITSITVSSGNTTYHAVNNCLIQPAVKQLVAGCKTSVIPTDGSITSIGNHAFYGRFEIFDINIPSTVTSIGHYAFSDCKDLTNITIPDGVTDIGTHAFANCENFTIITIPDSVTSIGDYAFSGCTALTSITLSNKIERIGLQMFSGCSKLSNVVIPNGVTSIGADAFQHCESLTSITIPDSMTLIGSSAFIGCNSLTSVNIPYGVTSINDYTFSSCTSLKSITIGNGVTSIGSRAFFNCSRLTSITYDGTKEQWKAITFGTNWNVETPDYIITCTDGTIAKDGTET